MNSWKEKLERIIAAITFADLDYRPAEPARGGTGDRRRRSEKGLLSKLDRIMLAITFAEADCHEIAAEFVEPDSAPKPVPAPSAAGGPAFAEVLGLKGVRVWYGVVEVS